MKIGTKSFCSNWIRNRDMFGQPILLSFNKKGNKYKTVIGGFISLFVLMSLITYLVIHIQKMIFYQDDKITIKESSVNLMKADEVKYRDMKYVFAIQLLNGTNMSPVNYDDEAKRHITIEFIQQHWDFPARPPIYSQRVSHGIRSCVPDDFNRTEAMKNEFIE